MKKVLVLVACFAMALVVGCSDKVSVKGKITYSDGTPVPAGRVTFSTLTFETDGDIQNGTYVMVEEGRGLGLPKNTYGVSVMVNGPTPIDAKYAHHKTSGLKFTVPSADGYNIVVEPSKQPLPPPSPASEDE